MRFILDSEVLSTLSYTPCEFTSYRLQKKPSDPDVFRLLGQVKYRLKDFEGSARAYRASAMVSAYAFLGHLSTFWLIYCFRRCHGI